MELYIKGTDMPATCGKCKIKNIIGCDRWKRVRSIALDRHRDCPLVPVPEQSIIASAKHMDADIFVGKTIYSDNLYIGADHDVCVAIDETPTIIPVEEEI